MARKTKSGRHQLNLYEELKDILDEYTNELKEKKEIALDKASDFFVERLEEVSPVDTGEFKKSWVRTTKYKSVRYVGNTRTAKNSQIPLSNLIEFSSKGKPFIRKTFEKHREEIVNIIKGELDNGNSK